MTAALLLAVVVLLLLTLLAVLVVRTATRLDRLHVRTDAAAAALDALLGRRAVVVRTLAAAERLPADDTGPLLAAAERDLAAAPSERERTANELGGLLAAVDRSALAPALAAELADAEQRVVIARRVFNDAVRDTRALRGRRLVRWLHLAGTAPWPHYFEITEPVTAAPGPARPVRASARVLLVDAAHRVLLFRFAENGRDAFWVTPGGGLDPGEGLRAAAVRELAEETGLRADPAALSGPVWFRSAHFALDGVPVEGHEWFFLLCVDSHEVDQSGFTELERATVYGHRWWPVAELATIVETVYPVQLAHALPVLLEGAWDGATRTVS